MFISTSSAKNLEQIESKKKRLRVRSFRPKNMYSFHQIKRKRIESLNVSQALSENENSDQVVPEQCTEFEEQERRRTWSYHCQVPEAKVETKGKLTEAAKSLSEEEMRLLEEDIFKPLDIWSIILKNCQENEN